jgi:hypothetical protein
MPRVTRAKIPQPPKCISCLCHHGGNAPYIRGVCDHHRGLFGKYKKCQEFL